MITTIRNKDVIISDPQRISSHIVNYYKRLFSSSNTVLQDRLLVEETIPKIIDDTTNNLFTMIPSLSEVKAAVFDLNHDGSPGPDGFGPCFFQAYWDIIHLDVYKAVLEFFQNGWLPPNFNANTLVLIPKIPSADKIEHYRPIALANFIFKIISKVLADRLAGILPFIISKEQRGFVKGRNIRDCIALASVAINVLDKKSFGGNLALKIDVSKAFDTLSWDFLLEVLQQFGFHSTFIHWIHSILLSAKISISINGVQAGYFNCNRGVRQGDPLSPLLFCIAEEVLSRGIAKLVEEGKVETIAASRSYHIPSHCFYADDLMVFCKGKISCLQALKELFTRYANCSGQIINLSKSSIHAGGVSNVRLNHMVQLIGFEIGTLPFTYLGVQIFRGKPKRIYFQPIADKIKIRLASWKASLLSMAGRVQLVKSVIQSMVIHTMTVYSWPISILRDIEKLIKKFIWSGDIDKRKLVTVAWKKVCVDLDEGGLGLRSLICLNQATNMKICWEMLHSEEHWAVILRSRVLRCSNCIQHHIFSSLWSGMKNEYNIVKENTAWLVGDGKHINFWFDHWNGEPLFETLNVPADQVNSFPPKLCNYFHDAHWRIPEDLLQQFPSLSLLNSQVILPKVAKPDKLVWKLNGTSILTLKEAYDFKKHHFNKVPWAKIIWSKDIPPSKSMLVWRLMLNKLPTDENLIARGCLLPSMCSLCNMNEESSFHLFFEGTYVINLWRWFASLINKQLQFQSVTDMWNICNRSWNPQCRLVIIAVMINIICTVWYERNQLRFSSRKIHWKSSLSTIISGTALTGNLSKVVASASVSNFVILKCFNVSIHPPKAPNIIEVLWKPPPPHWIKCNTDGSSTTLSSGCGGIFRNHDADFLLCFAENTDNSDAFHAELHGAMHAIELASQFHWKNLWLECDSALVINAIKNLSIVPWRLCNRWENCLHITRSMNFIATHIFREGNTCADVLANFGLSVAHLRVWLNIPDCIRETFGKNKLGLPFYRFY